MSESTENRLLHLKAVKTMAVKQISTFIREISEEAHKPQKKMSRGEVWYFSFAVSVSQPSLQHAEAL